MVLLLSLLVAPGWIQTSQHGVLITPPEQKFVFTLKGALWCAPESLFDSSLVAGFFTGYA
jgi:hypothetical protein